VWSERVNRWLESGQSAREFAEANDLNVWTLRGWRAKLTRGGRRGRSKRPVDIRSKEKAVRLASEQLPFVELLASSGAGSSHERIEIVLPSAITVRVPLRFDREAVRDLLAMLGGK
jgi:hypothetical protein